MCWIGRTLARDCALNWTTPIVTIPIAAKIADEYLILHMHTSSCDISFLPEAQPHRTNRHPDPGNTARSASCHFVVPAPAAFFASTARAPESPVVIVLKLPS